MKMTDSKLALELAPKANELLLGFTEVIMKQDPHPAVLFAALTQLFVSAVEVSGNDLAAMRAAFNAHVDAFVNETPSKH